MKLCKISFKLVNQSLTTSKLVAENTLINLSWKRRCLYWPWRTLLSVDRNWIALLLAIRDTLTVSHWIQSKSSWVSLNSLITRDTRSIRSGTICTLQRTDIPMELWKVLLQQGMKYFCKEMSLCLWKTYLRLSLCSAVGILTMRAQSLE